MDHTTDLLTAEELAVRLRVKPDTVRGWARRGMIPRLQLSSKVIRYDLHSVVAALTGQARRGGLSIPDGHTHQTNRMLDSADTSKTSQPALRPSEPAQPTRAGRTTRGGNDDRAS